VVELLEMAGRMSNMAERGSVSPKVTVNDPTVMIAQDAQDPTDRIR